MPDILVSCRLIVLARRNAVAVMELFESDRDLSGDLMNSGQQAGRHRVDVFNVFIRNNENMTMITWPPMGRDESCYVTVTKHDVLLLCRNVFILDSLYNKTERTNVPVRSMRGRLHSMDPIDACRRPAS